MCLAFVLTERSRIRVAIALMFFSITGTTCSKMLMLYGYHLLVRLQKYFSMVESYDAKFLPIFLLCAGTFGLIVNAFGIYLYFRCLYPLQRSHLYIQIFCHVYACGILCVSTMCICLVCCFHYLMVDKAFQDGIQPIMKKYRTDVTVKSLIDDLQINFKCCGGDDYTDWFRVAWMADAFINENDPDVRLRLRNGIYESDDVPYSCCDPKAPRSCISFHVHDDSKHFNYFHFKDLTIYHDGCREVLKDYFAKWVLSPILALSCVLCFLSLLVLLLARYLHTSMLAALQTDNPTADAMGYTSQCCIFVGEGMLNAVMNLDPIQPVYENIRPSVPAMCGQPPRPLISSSTTKS